MPRTLRSTLVVLASASLALTPGLAAAQSSGPGQVVDEAKKAGEGAAETAKDAGKSAADAGKKAGRSAEAIGDRLHDSAKGFGEALLDGIKHAGRTIIRFFDDDTP
jgi:hypothetical protein